MRKFPFLHPMNMWLVFTFTFMFVNLGVSDHSVSVITADYRPHTNQWICFKFLRTSQSVFFNAGNMCQIRDVSSEGPVEFTWN